MIELSIHEAGNLFLGGRRELAFMVMKFELSRSFDYSVKYFGVLWKSCVNQHFLENYTQEVVVMYSTISGLQSINL